MPLVLSLKANAAMCGNIFVIEKAVAARSGNIFFSVDEDPSTNHVIDKGNDCSIQL